MLRVFGVLRQGAPETIADEACDRLVLLPGGIDDGTILIVREDDL
jgi:hypothetical protein